MAAARLTVWFFAKGHSFNEITTYRMPYPKCCGLGDPDVAEDLLLTLEPIDRLSDYTIEMWDILTDGVLFEWFGLRLPQSKAPSGLIVLPPYLRLIYCLDRASARQARFEIQSHYLSADLAPDRMSIFAGYGLRIPEEFKREREGLAFIARQAEHFRSINDYLFITQTL